MIRFHTGCYFKTSAEISRTIFICESVYIEFTSNSEIKSIDNDSRYYGIDILAESEETAIDAADIMCACFAVVSGYDYMSTDDLIHINSIYYDDTFPVNAKQYVAFDNDILLHSCNMLKTVYGNQMLKKSVCKFYVAHQIYDLHPMDLHPNNDPFRCKYLLSEQIRIANVVANCYSIIEELKLEIRASKNNPSSINGEWNPDVKEELIKRLRNAGIDPEGNVTWLARNGVPRPFKAGIINNTELCEWSNGEGNKDFKINICDAILETSYIRSKKSSHGGEEVTDLTIYDAENAFTLARYILLRVCHINLHL